MNFISELHKNLLKSFRLISPNKPSEKRVIQLIDYIQQFKVQLKLCFPYFFDYLIESDILFQLRKYPAIHIKIKSLIKYQCENEIWANGYRDKLVPISYGTYGEIYRINESTVKKIYFDIEKSMCVTLKEIYFLKVISPKCLNTLQIIDVIIKNNKITLILPSYDIDLFNFIRTANINQRMTYFHVVANKLVDSLRSIHSYIYFHGDLKPGNILLKFDQINELNIDVAICDFGAIEVNDKIAECLTTSDYRSPELMGEIKSYGSFNDLWALGKILLEYLIGNTIRENKFSVNRILKRFERETGITFDSEHIKFIKRLLNKDIKKRYVYEGIEVKKLSEYHYIDRENPFINKDDVVNLEILGLYSKVIKIEKYSSLNSELIFSQCKRIIYKVYNVMSEAFDSLTYEILNGIGWNFYVDENYVIIE